MYGDYVCDIYENYLRSALVDVGQNGRLMEGTTDVSHV